jgi:hypothetical protein
VPFVVVPDVPVTITVYVPFGVRDPLPGPEHAVSASAGSISNTIASANRHARRRDVRISTSELIAATTAANDSQGGSGPGSGGFDDEFGSMNGPVAPPALVTIVEATVAVFFPSRVTEFDANEHDEFAGNPEQESDTVCVDPLTGATATVKLPDWPATTIREPGATLTPKSPLVEAFTVCVRAGDVLVAYEESPEYVAVIVCEPCASAELEYIAPPDASVTGEPSAAPPS